MSVAHSSFKGGGRGGGCRLIMADRANRMRAASCCDINITTVHQLLVTAVSWTKQWVSGMSSKRHRGCIMILLPVLAECSTFVQNSSVVFHWLTVWKNLKEKMDQLNHSQCKSQVLESRFPAHSNITHCFISNWPRIHQYWIKQPVRTERVLKGIFATISFASTMEEKWSSKEKHTSCHCA